jgi:hypothetical protein
LLVAIAIGLIVKSKPSPDITKQVGSVVLVLQGHPDAAHDIDQDAAVAAALRSMASQDAANGAPTVQGYTVTTAYHAVGLMRARTTDGRSMYSSDRPEDAWVLEFAAPPQLGWAHVSAFVIVDARTGRVISQSEALTN